MAPRGRPARRAPGAKKPTPRRRNVNPKRHLDNSLTAQQTTALHLISEGQSISSVAASLNISRETIYTWRKSRAWREQARVDADLKRESSMSMLSDLVPMALSTLHDLMKNGKEHNKLGAARCVLEAHHASVQSLQNQDALVDLERRLEEVMNETRATLPPETLALAETLPDQQPMDAVELAEIELVDD